MGPNAAAAKQAEQLRIDGNSYFKKDRFGAAIDAYTEVSSKLFSTLISLLAKMKTLGLLLICFVSRLSRSVPMFRFIGPIVLFAISNAST